MDYDHRAIVINDVHVPNQDDKAVYLFEEILTDLVATDPHERLELIIGGDFLDCFDVSTFPKVPDSHPNIIKEIELGHAFLSEWRKILGPRRKIHYVTGNHELRLRKHLLSETPEIYKLARQLGGLSVEKLLDLAHLNVEWYDLPEHLSSFKDAYFDWHGVLIGHFNRYSAHSAYTAKLLVDRFSASIVQGHTHRSGLHLKQVHGRLLFGIENGCLCNMKHTHETFANWQHSVTILTVKNEVVHPELVILQDYQAFVNNKFYSYPGGAETALV